jgi:hypothetical protein
MTRKVYTAIAQQIRQVYRSKSSSPEIEETLRSLAVAIADIFGASNPRFDEATFLIEALGPKAPQSWLFGWGEGAIPLQRPVWPATTIEIKGTQTGRIEGSAAGNSNITDGNGKGKQFPEV